MEGGRKGGKEDVCVCGAVLLVVSLGSVAPLLTLPHSDEIGGLNYQY